LPWAESGSNCNRKCIPDLINGKLYSATPGPVSRQLGPAVSVTVMPTLAYKLLIGIGNEIATKSSKFRHDDDRSDCNSQLDFAAAASASLSASDSHGALASAPGPCYWHGCGTGSSKSESTLSLVHAEYHCQCQRPQHCGSSHGGKFNCYNIKLTQLDHDVVTVGS
jgi:hypothetical protein